MRGGCSLARKAEGVAKNKKVVARRDRGNGTHDVIRKQPGGNKFFSEKRHPFLLREMPAPLRPQMKSKQIKRSRDTGATIRAQLSKLYRTLCPGKLPSKIYDRMYKLLRLPYPFCPDDIHFARITSTQPRISFDAYYIVLGDLLL